MSQEIDSESEPIDEVYFRSFIGGAGRDQQSFFSVDHPKVIRCYVKILFCDAGYVDQTYSTILDLQMRGIPYDDYVFTFSVIDPESSEKEREVGNSSSKKTRERRISVFYKLSEMISVDEVITSKSYRILFTRNGEETTFEIEFKYPQDAEFFFKVFDTLLRTETEREIKFPLPLGPHYPNEFSWKVEEDENGSRMNRPQLLTQENYGGISSVIGKVTFSSNVQSLGLADEKFDEEFSKLAYDQWTRPHYDYIFMQIYVQITPTKKKSKKMKKGDDGKKRKENIISLRKYLSSKKTDLQPHSDDEQQQQPQQKKKVNKKSVKVILYDLLIQYFIEEKNTFLNLQYDIDHWIRNEKEQIPHLKLLTPIFEDQYALSTLSYYVDFVLDDLHHYFPVSYLKVLSKRLKNSKDDLDLDELRKKLRYEHRHLWDVEFLFLKLMFSVLYHFDFDDFVRMLETKFEHAEQEIMKKWRKTRKRIERENNNKKKKKNRRGEKEEEEEEDVLSFTSDEEEEEDELGGRRKTDKSLADFGETGELEDVTFIDLENFMNEEDQQQHQKQDDDEDMKFKSLMFDTYIQSDDYEIGIYPQNMQNENSDPNMNNSTAEELTKSYLFKSSTTKTTSTTTNNHDDDDDDEGFDLLDDGVTKIDPIQYESFISNFNLSYNLDTGGGRKNNSTFGFINTTVDNNNTQQQTTTGTGTRSSTTSSSFGSIESFSFKVFLRMKQNELRYKKLLLQNQNLQSFRDSSGDYDKVRMKVEKLRKGYNKMVEKRNRLLEQEIEMLKTIKSLDDQILQLSSSSPSTPNNDDDEIQTKSLLNDIPEKEEKEDELRKTKKKLEGVRKWINTSNRVIEKTEKSKSQAEGQLREADEMNEKEKEVIGCEMEIIDDQIRQVFSDYLKDPKMFEADQLQFLYSKERKSALERLIKKRIREYTAKGRKDFRVIVKIVFSVLKSKLEQPQQHHKNNDNNIIEEEDVLSPNHQKNEMMMTKKLRFLHYVDTLIKPTCFEFGTLHTSILVKNIGIHWFSNSLVRIKELRHTDMYEDLLCLDTRCGTLIGSPQMLYKKLLDLAHTLVSWNTYRSYSPYEIVDKGRRNCQQFTRSILRGLGATPFFRESESYLEELKKIFLQNTALFGGVGDEGLMMKKKKKKKMGFCLDRLMFLEVDVSSSFYRKFKKPLRLCFENRRRSSMMLDDDDEEEEEEGEGEEDSNCQTTTATTTTTTTTTITKKRYYIGRHKDLDDFVRQAMLKDGNLEVNHPEEMQLLKGFDRAFAMKHFKARGLIRRKVLVDAEKEMKEMEVYEKSRYGCPFDHKFVLKRKKVLNLD